MNPSKPKRNRNFNTLILGVAVENMVNDVYNLILLLKRRSLHLLAKVMILHA